MERIPRSRHEAVIDHRLITKLPRLLSGSLLIAAGLAMRLFPPLYRFLRYALIKPVGDAMLQVVWAVLLLAGAALLIGLRRRMPIYKGITVYADGVGTIMRAIDRESFTPYASIEIHYPKGTPEKGLELRSRAYLRPIRVQPHEITHYGLLSENLVRCSQEDAQHRAQIAAERRAAAGEE